MAGLIPSRKKRTEATGNGGNGGPLAPMRDFPTLMRRMQSEFDELVRRFTQDFSTSGNGENGWRWGLDVEDKEDSIVVRAEAPGFEAGDFDIQVSDNRLVLRASRKTESKKKEGEFREQCECYESMTLPSGIDREKIDARYHNGVLTLTIPKTAEGKAKKITVKSS